MHRRVEDDGSGAQIFSLCPIHTRVVLCKATKFGSITHLGEVRLCMGPSHPNPRAQGSGLPIFGTTSYDHMVIWCNAVQTNFPRWLNYVTGNFLRVHRALDLGGCRLFRADNFWPHCICSYHLTQSEDNVSIHASWMDTFLGLITLPTWGAREPNVSQLIHTDTVYEELPKSTVDTIYPMSQKNRTLFLPIIRQMLTYFQNISLSDSAEIA